MRHNRLGYPEDLVKPNPQVRQLPRGASEWRQCQDSAMFATAWKDKKMVYYLSTAHAPEGEQAQVVTRRQKDGTQVELPCPLTVAAYAKYMNGVDKLDQMTRQNKSQKSMKWYKRVETKLMEARLYNIYVIEGHVILRSKRDFLSFKLDLVHQLVGSQYKEKATARRPRSAANNNDPRLDRLDHWPIRGEGKDHTCVVCCARHKDYQRRHPGVSYANNPFKQRKTTMLCEKCDVYLYCNQYDCFKVYHTRVTYM